MFASKARSAVAEDQSSRAPRAPTAEAPSAVQPPAPAPLRETPPVRDSKAAKPSLIGADMTLVGNIVTKGEVHVTGEIKGEVESGAVTIGESGQIDGGVMAQDVVVHGTVDGRIRGLRVALRAGSRVEGEVHHQSLVIEQGALFEGKSRRSDDPFAERE